MMSSLAYLLFESELSFSKRFLGTYTKICVSQISIFVNEGASYDICETFLRF